MNAEATLHRHIRKPLVTAALVAIMIAFAVAPLIERELLGIDASLSLPLGLLGAGWTVITSLAFRAGGIDSRLFRALNRGETAVLLAVCLIPICVSGNAMSPLWLLHFAHVVTCGTSGAERRYNISLFTLLPIAVVVGFGLTHGAAAASVVAAFAGASLYTYVVMSATSSRLTATREQRNALQRQLTTLMVQRERERIARDLHDGVGTELSSLFWQLQSLRATAATPDAEASFDALTHRITQSTDELRNVVWELRANSLAWPELVAHLRTRCLAIAGDEASVTLEAAPAEGVTVPGEVLMHVARIVQEAVRNAIHHGRARNVALKLDLGRHLVLEVTDDGTGIAPEAARRSVGGLRNMEVRVQSLGGAFSVGPGPCGGTRLHAELPLSQVASTASA
jgi:signal transduction histidine kinase